MTFETGEGLQAGKTEVIYKGMSIGKLTALELDDSGEQRGVRATLEMDKRVEHQLLSNTRFWLVKPSVALLAGITGLETLAAAITLPPARVMVSLRASSPHSMSRHRWPIPRLACT